MEGSSLGAESGFLLQNQAVEETTRQNAVLFADVSGSTKLYETRGDIIALEAIGRCIEALKQVTGKCGGRVVKTIGDEVMALFPTANSAAQAAAAMHGAMESLPAVGETKLGLRIGFQCGPVIQKDDDVFGDTVNLASRLVETAVKDQIITSADTALQLPAMYRPFIRRLYAIQVKGKSDPVELCELVWRHDDDATQMLASKPKARADIPPLKLVFRSKETVRRRENDAITLGRDLECGLVVPEGNASRRHCTIERRGDKWILKDHSTNGTYITVEGDSELLLQREEITLRGRGVIACGQPRAESAEVVQYSCE
jgi:class 3 adenylate cyclase